MHITVDDFAKLLEALTKLFSVLVWPAMALFILVRFDRTFREFFANLGEISLKGAGFEASAKRKQAEAAAALSAAFVAHPQSSSTPHQAPAKAAVDLVQEVATPRVIRRAANATILWVDDRPENNVHERQALEALGIKIVLATSTDEALEKVMLQSFGAIISDMGRPPDPRAGYTLLKKLRAIGNRTPFIIYAGSRSPEHQAEARDRGAIGCTNRPDELFEMVLMALSRRSQT